MPAISQAQRGYLAEHFGPAWMKKHHFDNTFVRVPYFVPYIGVDENDNPDYHADRCVAPIPVSLPSNNVTLIGSGNLLGLDSNSNSQFALSDDILNNTLVEIIVYP